METILPIITPYDSLLGPQKVKVEADYRLMQFVVSQTTDDDGLLLFNTLTKSMIRLSMQEAVLLKSCPQKLPALIEEWFLVPQQHDDRLLSRQMRAVGRMLKSASTAIRSYTIFTTSDCNARCFYCFEKGQKRTQMSADVALRTADYIASHCGDKKVELAWFGGEPLYNKKVINIICHRLKELGVDYCSTMTSNAYLMDADTVREATEVWKLEGIQVTLDGTEEVYNRVKAYIYNDGSAYRKVINNIHLMLEAGISVKIRLNVDRHNADNLMALADELDKEFPNKKGINVYSSPIFGECVKNAAIYSDESRHEIYEKRQLLQQKLRKSRLAKTERLKRWLQLNQCMADSSDSISILPNGQIGKCEHFLESNFVGHIDSPELDKEALDDFRRSFDELPECATCATYPECFRLDKCEPAHLCSQESRQENEEKIREQMVREYKHYLKAKEKHEV